ncbi:MAG: hypothetical protein J6M60_00805 [Clostridia bacterium]|nr:hypothetical protein [Clostridia bacterium]
MDVINIIEMVASFLFMAIAVIMVFDARRLTNKFFSFSDQNNGSKWMKLGGLLVFLIGIILLFVAIK